MGFFLRLAECHTCRAQALVCHVDRNRPDGSTVWVDFHYDGDGERCKGTIGRMLPAYDDEKEN